jgi:hypothetical protein
MIEVWGVTKDRVQNSIPMDEVLTQARCAQAEAAAKGERKKERKERKKKTFLRIAVDAVIGGAAGVVIAYYLLNLFGGPRFNFARVYLPGVEHTAACRPAWWPDWLEFGNESTSDTDGESAELPDTTPTDNPGEVAAEASESPINTNGIRGETIRVWKDNTGQFEVEAEYLNIDDEGVCLRKTDGKEIKVPLSRLSQEDQAWLEANASFEEQTTGLE